MRAEVVWGGELFRAAAFAIVCWRLATAQNPEAGSTAFELFRMNHTARDISMAGASIGLPGGVIGSYANPASQAYLKDMQVAVGYRSLVLDVWSSVLAFGMPIERTGYWSLSLLNLSEGTVREVLNQDGLPVETGREWRSNVVTGSLGWSRILWRALSVGGTVKVAYHYIGTAGEYYSSDGMALDIGTQYRTLPGDRLVFGAVLRNVGFVRSSYAADVERGVLPIAIGLGMSYVPYYLRPLRIALDFEKSYGGSFDIEPGVEIAILRDLLFVRAGYAFSDAEVEYIGDVLGGRQEPNYEKAQWNALCLGMGLRTGVREVRIGADAALEFHTVGQPSVAITLMAGF